MKKKHMVPIVILLLVIVAVVGIFLWQRSHVSFYSNENGSKSVVIGGADGPTSIFITGKLGGSDEGQIESEEGITEMGDVIEICVGDNTLEMVLEENESAKELLELLKEEDITMPASNYGGFEKVCKLGKSITSNDEQITTEAGDVMLYQGNQVVIFYDSNSWAYTRIGRINTSQEILEQELSGDDNEVILHLVQ